MEYRRPFPLCIFTWSYYCVHLCPYPTMCVCVLILQGVYVLTLPYNDTSLWTRTHTCSYFTVIIHSYLHFLPFYPNDVVFASRRSKIHRHLSASIFVRTGISARIVSASLAPFASTEASSAHLKHALFFTSACGSFRLYIRCDSTEKDTTLKTRVWCWFLVTEPWSQDFPHGIVHYLVTKLQVFIHPKIILLIRTQQFQSPSWKPSIIMVPGG